MLPTITKTQKQIIQHLIYRYRFITRIHIQQFLDHKNPAKINIWLKDLTDKKYLNRIYSPTYGENIKPAIYYMGTNGIRFMKQLHPDNSLSIQNLYYEKKRTPIFHTHCFALAEFACNLITYAKDQNKDALILTKADFSNDEANDSYEIFHTLKPDGFYTYTGTGISKTCFIEVVDDLTPSFVLRKKIHRYMQANQELNWETLNMDKFPSIIFLLQTKKKMESLARAIRRVRNEIEDEEITQALRCNLALVSDLQKHSIASNIWQRA